MLKQQAILKARVKLRHTAEVIVCIYIFITLIMAAIILFATIVLNVKMTVRCLPLKLILILTSVRTIRKIFET